MFTGKAISKSVSMPADLWEAVERHAVTKGADRSGYLRGLAAADLERHQQSNSLHQLMAEAVEAGVDVEAVITRSMRRAARTQEGAA